MGGPMVQPQQMAVPGPDELSLDKLTGEWSIYQLKRGHRFSSDDLLTAWMATEVAPDAMLQLDLGAGIGSVGLLSLARRPANSRLVMVEPNTSVMNWPKKRCG